MIGFKLTGINETIDLEFILDGDKVSIIIQDERDTGASCIVNRNDFMTMVRLMRQQERIEKEDE